jgi:peroxiredoxin
MAAKLATSRQLAAMVLCCGSLCSLVTTSVQAATPSAEQALKLTPIQRDVDYDRPSAAEAARCTIHAEKRKGQTGWVVRDGDGKMLREFVDTNGDNVVDRWSYYKDGVEVYRDIDPKFNGKATEHRWLNTAGVRWGVSRAGDGQIDYWKMISAEEVSAEVVMALRDRDPTRFGRLLLSPAELKSLGMSAAKTKEMAEKLSAAQNNFTELARRQSLVTADTAWVHFGGNRPGIVPAGTFGLPTDIEVYENVVALVQTGGKDSQIQIGTMIRVGECWRLVDVPIVPESGKLTESTGGVFFLTGSVRGANAQDMATAAGDNRLQKMLEQLQRLDDAIAKAAPEDQAKLNDERADFFEQLVAQSTDKERAQWVHQLADTLSAAVQGGTYPKGAERLKSISRKLERTPADADLAAYVEFRSLSAEYALALQAPNPDFPKIQAAWLENLERFVTQHPKTPDSADAMLQLGMAQEFAGQDDKAKSWYRQIAEVAEGTPAAKKAAGAIRRLDSVGKSINLVGRSTGGEQVDLANYKGKYVLVQYWATWCAPATVELAELKRLQAKYATQGFAIIGVSLDTTRDPLDSYLANNPLSWPQLFESGGLDSRYANEMGILTLPTMILIDDSGRVINRGIHITELDGVLKARLK